MIVECPSCSSTFNLPDELVPPGGRKVKCSVCEHVFEVRPEAAPAGEPADEPADEPGDESIFGEDEDLAGVLDDAFAEGDDDDGGEAPAPRGADAPDEDAGGGSGGLGFDLDSAPAKKKGKGGKGKLVGIIAACVLAVVLAAGAGVYFFAPGLIGMAPAEEQAAAESPMTMAEQVKSISLEDIRQYYVANDKAGRIFVIEGKAVNQFAEPRELIEVEAGLYDAQNNVLDTVRLMCGNTLSLFQLQVLSREEIEKALKDEAGIGANNVNLQHGQHVPFMIVFFDPSDKVAEFNVSVVAAKDVKDL